MSNATDENEDDRTLSDSASEEINIFRLFLESLDQAAIPDIRKDYQLVNMQTNIPLELLTEITLHFSPTDLQFDLKSNLETFLKLENYNAIKPCYIVSRNVQRDTNMDTGIFIYDKQSTIMLYLLFGDDN